MPNPLVVSPKLWSEVYLGPILVFLCNLGRPWEVEILEAGRPVISEPKVVSLKNPCRMY